MTKKTIVIKSIVLTAIAILPCFLNKTSALALHDCDVITGNIQNFRTEFFKDKKIDYSQAFSGDALDRAIRNLNTYCCKKVLNQLKKQPDPRCNPDNYTDKYPESPYLFDHLVDVGLRSLDAINGYTDVAVDPTGKKRRDYVQGIATNPEATNPMGIINKYEHFRTLKKDRMFKKMSLKISSMDTDEKGKLSTYFEKYAEEDEVSLADKYNNLCWIAWNIYEKKPGPKISIGSDKLGKGRSYYTDCQKMVARRVNQENLYIKTILVDKANKMLKDNLEATLQKQFVQDKLVGLQKIIVGIKDLLQTIVKQAPYCKKCSR